MSDASTALQGRRVLVAEDEYIIAQEIVEALSDAGATVLGPVPRLTGALQLVASNQQIDGAVLDVNLGNEAVWPVVDLLLSRNVPLVLGTGYDASAIPTAYVGLSRCEKPSTGRDLARALAHALAAAAHR